MTAAFEENLTARKNRARLQSLCEVYRHKMPTKRQRQWQQISKVIAEIPRGTGDAKEQASEWQRKCKAAGIGAGLLSWFFWNFFLPFLIALAEDWLRNETELSSNT